MPDQKLSLAEWLLPADAQLLSVLGGEASHCWLLELIPLQMKHRLQTRHLESVSNLYRKGRDLSVIKRLPFLADMCMCLHEFICIMYVQIPVGATGCRVPGTGVLGSCELPVWVLGLRLWSSALNC